MKTTAARSEAQNRQDHNRDSLGRFQHRTWAESSQQLAQGSAILVSDHRTLGSTLAPGQGAFDLGASSDAPHVGVEFTDKNFTDEGYREYIEWQGVSLRRCALDMESSEAAVSDSTLSDTNVRINGGAFTNVSLHGSDINAPVFNKPLDDADVSLVDCHAQESVVVVRSIDRGEFTDSRVGTQVAAGARFINCTTFADDAEHCTVERGDFMVDSLRHGVVSDSTVLAKTVSNTEFRGTCTVSPNLGLVINIDECTGSVGLRPQRASNINGCDLDRFTLVDSRGGEAYEAGSHMSDCVTISNSVIRDFRDDSQTGIDIDLEQSTIGLDQNRDVAFARVSGSTISGSSTGLFVTGTLTDSVVRGDFPGASFGGGGDTMLSGEFDGRFDGASFARRTVFGTYAGSYRGTVWRGSDIDAKLEGDFSGADMRSTGLANDATLAFTTHHAPIVYDDNTSFPRGYDPKAPRNAKHWVHADRVDKKVLQDLDAKPS